MSKTIKDVQGFWEANPLWTGESSHQPGTKAFFDEHRQVYVNDCYAGKLNDYSFPDRARSKRILDVGCGPGFWPIEFGLRNFEKINATDLTANALNLARRRCELYQVQCNFTQQNAEKLAFCNAAFAHINCIGVIHHTPNTEMSIREIARVLEDNGTASISVYYRNIILRMWPRLSIVGKLLAKTGAGLKGRGRENIYSTDDVDEIVRLYDGQDNPIGKSYTYDKFIHMLLPYFYIRQIYLYFFLARSLPFKMPQKFHQFLNKRVGFMICADVEKR